MQTTPDLQPVAGLAPPCLNEPTRVWTKGPWDVWTYADERLCLAPKPEAIVLFPGCHLRQPKPTQLDLLIPRTLTRAWGLRRDLLQLPAPWPSLARSPFPYQFEASAFLQAHEGAYLCLPIGSGKSAVLAAAARARVQARGGPVVISTLRSLAPNWRQELISLGFLYEGKDPRWAELRTRPQLKLDGSTDLSRLGLSPAAEWIFCHPEILQAWSGFLAPSVLILDEAHLFGNHRTQRTQGAAIVASSVHARQGHVWGASGTPLLGNGRQLWSVLQLLEPGGWGSEHDYRVRYLGATLGQHGWQDGDLTHTEELNARLSHTMFLRTREELKLQLPQLSYSLVASDASAKLKQASTTVLGANPEHVIQMLLDGRNLSKQTLQYITKLRVLASREKVATTVELVNTLLLQGAKPVIFVSFKETAAKLQYHLDGALTLTGDTGRVSREAVITEFKARCQRQGLPPHCLLAGTPPILIATYDVLSVGVNLQVADNVVHHDLTWVPATHLQATGRAWRVGQEATQVAAHLVFARETLDEVLARALISKIRDIGQVDRGGLETEYQSFAALLKEDEVARWVNYARLSEEE